MGCTGWVAMHGVNVRVDDTYIIMLHEYIMIILTCVRYDQVVQLLVMTMYS